jgi:hypothetical protein
MTIIHQDSVSDRHSVDDTSHQAAAGYEGDINSTQGLHSSTINISFQAELRLRAFQEKRKSQINPAAAELELNSNKKIQSGNINSSFDSMAGIVPEIAQKQHSDSGFSRRISNMLLEVQNNIVQSGDSGYQYLVNVLQNNKETVEDQRQLQEIMRKEQFFLTRRKPFMQNSDFQSYSQVLSQFSNIVERQQYSL